MLALRSVASVTAVLATVFLASATSAQQFFFYPQKGQTQQQQQQDRFECHQWAVQQSGFDPTMAVGGAAPPPPPSMAGGALRGAAGGAALGVVGGAIGGNAGRGAAIGAGTGALFGTVRRNNQIRDQHQQQVNANNQVNQQLAGFNRALSACMSGRGYTVN